MKSPVEPLEKVIRELAHLPGVGRRSAERMAYHLLAADEAEAMGLAMAVRDLKKKTRPCKACGAITAEELCAFCSDPARDRSVICVVEFPRDVTQIEKTGAYRGLYHVLMGHLSPIDGVEAEGLRIRELTRRLSGDGDEVKEVILALNPNVEGDATAALVSEMLGGTGVRTTRPARGLPAGSEIEFADPRVLTDAITGREALGADDPGHGSGGRADG